MTQASLHGNGSIGEFLRAQRLGAGLTQSELADRLGTSQPAVARWESGRDDPRLSTLRSYVQACGRELSLHVDDGVDRTLIQQQLALPVEARIRSNQSLVELRGLASK